MNNCRQFAPVLVSSAIATMLASCTTTSAITPSKQVYVAYSITTPKSSEFSRSANYEIAKNINPNRQVNVDILTGDRVKNVYSNAADRGDLQRLDAFLQQVSPADDRALIAAVKRVQEILKTTETLTVYLVTSGTTDPQTLSAIAAIAEEIDRERGGKQLKIYLLGLLPENKIPTAAAFKAIATNMGGSCIDDYSQCRGFIDALIE